MEGRKFFDSLANSEFREFGFVRVGLQYGKRIRRAS